MAATNINLLPVDLSAKSQAARLGSFLKKATKVLIGLFSVAGLLSGIFIVVLSLQLDSVNKKNETLRQNISALETTEQKTVLVRNRLEKIKILGDKDKAIGSVAILSGIVSSLPSGVSLTDANADLSGGLTYSFNVSDSSVLPQFLGSLMANQSFSKLGIKNFSFSPLSGYKITLEAQAK